MARVLRISIQKTSKLTYWPHNSHINKRFEFSFERLHTDSVTYLPIGQEPSQKYFLDVSHELAAYWPKSVCGISDKGAVFDAKTGKMISQDADVQVNRKYNILKRVIPIPTIINDLIETEKFKHKKSDWMFPNKSGELASASSLKSRWHTYLVDMDIYYSGKKNKHDKTRNEKEKILSIKKFTPYDLRHTYATTLANSGVRDIILATLIPIVGTIQ